MAASQNFSMYAGDTKQVVVTVKKDDGSALDLTGATVRWGFDTVVKTTSSGIVLTTPLSGIFTITISPTDTVGKTGEFQHGGTVTDAAGNVSTVIVGKITINKNVI